MNIKSFVTFSLFLAITANSSHSAEPLFKDKLGGGPLIIKGVYLDMGIQELQAVINNLKTSENLNIDECRGLKDNRKIYYSCGGVPEAPGVSGVSQFVFDDNKLITFKLGLEFFNAQGVDGKVFINKFASDHKLSSCERGYGRGYFISCNRYSQGYSIQVEEDGVRVTKKSSGLSLPYF